MIDRRVASGGGSCAACRGRLGLAAVHVGGRWYCDTDCARGRPDHHVRERDRPARVPETRLIARPRRFFRRRGPKELNSTRPGR